MTATTSLPGRPTRCAGDHWGHALTGAAGAFADGGRRLRADPGRAHAWRPAAGAVLWRAGDELRARSRAGSRVVAVTTAPGCTCLQGSARPRTRRCGSPARLRRRCSRWWRGSARLRAVPSGCSAAWQRAAFGTQRPWVQIPPPRLKAFLPLRLATRRRFPGASESERYPRRSRPSCDRTACRRRAHQQ